MNIPLPAGPPGRGLADVDYEYVWCSLVTPLLAQYAPEMVVVAAGFDAGEWDRDLSIGGYSLTKRAFCYMVKSIQSYCSSHPLPASDVSTDNNRGARQFPGLMLCLEGGYSVDGMAECVSLIVGSLLEENIDIGGDSAAQPAVSAAVNATRDPAVAVTTEVKAVVEDTKAVLATYWTL